METDFRYTARSNIISLNDQLVLLSHSHASNLTTCKNVTLQDALRVPMQLLEPPEDDDERIAMGLPVLDKRPVSTSKAVKL